MVSSDCASSPPNPLVRAALLKGVETFLLFLGPTLKLGPCRARFELWAQCKWKPPGKHGKPPFITSEVECLDFGGEEKWQVTAYYQCKFPPCVDAQLADEKPTGVYAGDRKLIIKWR